VTSHTQFDVLVERLDHVIEKLDRLLTHHEKLEARVSDLERSRAWILGAGMFGGAMLGWLGNLAASVLTK